MFNMKEYLKQWRQEHKEYQQEYRQRHREELLKYAKEYRQEHREKLLEYGKDYRLKHRGERLEYQKQWQESHPEYLPKYLKNYLKTEAGKMAIQRMHIRRRAKMKEIINTLTAEEWLNILGQYNFRCAYCGKNLLSLFDQATRDHIIPISRGGNNTKDNVIPACRSCNSKKKNRI